MLSLSGICAKQLKDQGKLPEKFNDLACEPILQDVGECYLGTGAHTLYTGKSVPYNKYLGLTLMTPYGTDLCTSGIADFSKEWEIETYFTMTQLYSRFLYFPFVYGFKNSKTDELSSLAGFSSFGGSSENPDVKITELGTYGAKILHKENSKSLEFYYSFNGSDFKLANNDSGPYNFTKKPNYGEAYLGLGKAYSDCKGKYIHNLSGTKLAVDGKVLFYKA